LANRIVFRIWEFVGKKYLIVEFCFILCLELFWYRDVAELCVRETRG
jgi:hypothetical protein